MLHKHEFGYNKIPTKQKNHPFKTTGTRSTLENVPLELNYEYISFREQII